jgi:DMSO/TMAO reductase YedYZ heme-binding membrane subunit
VIVVREALGNATVFHVAAHVLAMGLMSPVYLIDYTNPEDLPGLASSTIVAVLALTSLPAVKRRMRAATWKRIHRWIYVAWASIVLVVVMSRPWTAIPHLVLVFVLLGYRVALWRDRRKTGRRMAAADRVNYVAMTVAFVAVVLLSGREALKEGLGIGLFSGIGG